MRTAPLSQVSKINPKGPKSGTLPLDEEFDFVPMASVSEEGKMTVGEQRPYANVAKGFTVFQNNDVLLAKITPCFENNKIALAKVNTSYAFGSTEFYVIRCDHDEIDPQYLTYFLRQNQVRYAGERRMTGSAGQRRVPKAFLEELEIPLPPLDEQKRIAAILDQADALRGLRQCALDQLNTLGQSIFYEMFGDPLSNPMGWPEDQKLREVADIVSGITKGRKLKKQATRKVPYLAVVNVQDKSLVLDPLKSIEATENEIDRYRLQPNDLLLTEGGDPDKLGRGTLWQGELPECIHQNHVFRVRLVSKCLNPVFLNWLVGSQRGKRYFLRSAKQTTGIASINMTQLKDFPLIVPPIKLQNEFGNRLGSIEVNRRSAIKAIEFNNALFASLQQCAFKGRL